MEYCVRLFKMAEDNYVQVLSVPTYDSDNKCYRTQICYGQKCDQCCALLGGNLKVSFTVVGVYIHWSIRWVNQLSSVSKSEMKITKYIRIAVVIVELFRDNKLIYLVGAEYMLVK